MLKKKKEVDLKVETIHLALIVGFGISLFYVFYKTLFQATGEFFNA